MSFNVLLLDNVDPVCAEIFKERGINADQPPKMELDELKKVIGNYEAIVVRSATTVDEDLLKHADKLKIIGRAGVGVDNIDIPAATQKGVLVMNTPDGNTILAIGDVTGKGVPAALLMANLQSMLHVLLPVDITLSEATERMNNLIFKNTPSDKFITFFWAKYLSTHKILRYVNAGHNPPLLLR